MFLMKRIFDLIFSFTAILFLSPLLALICIAIKFDSKGPILFKQNRVGMHQEIFQLYKFRTMYYDQSSDGEIGNNESAAQARKRYITTTVNDSRITKIGMLLRKYHIDELPQLLNILKNEMSLIGPRPDVPAQKIDYSKNQWIRRHKVKPGISGLAQIYSGSPKFSYSLRVALDLKYQKSKSLLLDVFIFQQTIRKVLLGKSF